MVYVELMSYCQWYWHCSVSKELHFYKQLEVNHISNLLHFKILVHIHTHT